MGGGFEISVSVDTDYQRTFGIQHTRPALCLGVSVALLRRLEVCRYYLPSSY